MLYKKNKYNSNNKKPENRVIDFVNRYDIIKYRCDNTKAKEI